MRLMTNNALRLDEDRIVCRRACHRGCALALILLGGAMMLGSSGCSVRPSVTAELIAFVAMPGFGFMTAGALLYAYEVTTTIDVPAGIVIARERLFGLCLRKSVWRVDHFESVRAIVRASGREGKPGVYSTVTLQAPRENVPLFDMESHPEARRVSRVLASRLGLR